MVRYIHLPGSLNVAMRVEAKRNEVAAARKAHAQAQGEQPALAKGADFQGAGDWSPEGPEEEEEEDMDEEEGMQYAEEDAPEA